MPANEIFSVGERIGQLDPDSISNVEIEILSIDDNDTITAKVVTLGSFFSAERLAGLNSSTQGFNLDEVLTLTKMNRSETGHFWTISNPTNRPWHSLIAANDKKHFTHYR